MRRDVLKLTAVLSSIDTTSLLTSELQATQRITVEEFMSEGVIILTYGEKGGRLERSLLIQKMRGTNHSLERRPFAITERGLEVFPQEIVYEM